MANQAQIQTQGIQQLLAAEKRAADKVNASRRRKAKKLRQAKDEAEEEIEKFRRDRDQQFHEYVNKHVGTRGDAEKQIDIETNRKIDELNRVAASQMDTAVGGILEIIQEIKPVLHRNFRNVA